MECPFTKTKEETASNVYRFIKLGTQFAKL